jgi:hypothetical protein
LTRKPPFHRDQHRQVRSAGDIRIDVYAGYVHAHFSEPGEAEADRRGAIMRNIHPMHVLHGRGLPLVKFRTGRGR